MTGAVDMTIPRMPATVEIHSPLTITSLPSRGLDLCCPECGTVRLHISPHESEVPGGGYFLNDGDTIPSLYGRLTEAGKLYKDIGFDCELLVGFCPSCDSDYFVVEAKLVASPVEFESNYAHVYFHMNGDRGQKTNLTVSAIIPGDQNLSWWSSRFETPKGPLLHHCFGPYQLLDKGMVSGPWGIMSCGVSSGEQSPWTFAADLLLSAWDALVELTRRIDAEATTSRSGRIQASPFPDMDSVSSSMEHPETLDQLRSAQCESGALELGRRHGQEPDTWPASSGSHLSCESTNLQVCEHANQTRNEAIQAVEQPLSDSSMAESRKSQGRYKV